MYNHSSEPHNSYDQPQYEQQQYEEPSLYSAGYRPEQQTPEQPVYGQPVPPVQPAYGQPVYGQPAQPIYTQPVYGQPVQPVYGQPVYVQPIQPVYVQPVPFYAQAQVNVQIGMAGVIMEPPKSWLTTLLLCIFLGPLGIHRFYSGHIGIGLFQFFTWGGFGIWWLIDLILILTGNYTDKYGRPLQR